MRRHILVSGMDYEFGGVSFRTFADNRQRLLTQRNKARVDLSFEIFDFRTGEVLTTDVTYPGGKETVQVSRNALRAPMSKANYESSAGGNPRLKNNQDDVMSVLDVYSAVRSIGAVDPSTLVELSFFSHAWMGGPILVNSFDDRTGHISTPSPTGGPPTLAAFTVPSTARDPDDKDPRQHLDFTAPTMNSLALADFKRAFAPDGLSWIWGCAFPRLIHQILHKVEHHPSYRARGLGDEVDFTFTDLTKDEAALLERLLKPAIGPFPDRRKIKLKFKHLKFFFGRELESSYSFHLAANSGRPVLAGLLGTYSEYESGRNALMRVPAIFAAHFNFYRQYLGFTFDPEKRNYGIYQPDFAGPEITP